MTTFHFRAQALSPVYIGCGREIDPSEFVLKGDRLVHINLGMLIGSLPPQDRERFSGFLDRADLKEIQNFLRHHTDEAKHGVSRIDISKGFRQEYESKASNPNNQFRVEMMPRNPHTGAAYIPGSSIKGAIRTAVINHLANNVPAIKKAVHEAVDKADARRKAQVLEEQALDRQHRDTHRDVFRLIHVEDCDLLDNSTRIDRAANFNPFKSGSEKIQMWVERVKSVADMSSPPDFKVSMRIDMRAMKNERVAKTLGRILDFDTICEACNRFYWGRMLAEGKRFDGREQDAASWRSIHKLFPQGKFDDGEPVTIDPSKSFWNNPDAKRKRMLLRVGRFSHFESLSVDGLRRGWNAQSRRPIEDMGATRTRCVMENGKPSMPFGWMLLTLDSEKGITNY